jgi:hypothetical protein
LPSESGADPAATDQPTAPAVTADGKLKGGDYELSTDDIAMLMQTKAANDLRATQVPADPSQYKIELPKDFGRPWSTCS